MNFITILLGRSGPVIDWLIELFLLAREKNNGNVTTVI